MGGGQLFSSSLDPERKIILGCRASIIRKSLLHLTKTNRSEDLSKLSQAQAPLIFVGTDVSGKLHLGHLCLLSIAQALTDSLKSKLVVSLNEIESICSRNNNLKEVYKNKTEITNFLTQNGATVHSRANDTDLILFATRIWRMILMDKGKYKNLNKYYIEKLDPADALSVIVMAVAPLFVSLKEKSDSILMVYGEDELSHLEYIYDLYKSPWFKREVMQMCNTTTPDLNYLTIRLLPDIKNEFKMSKTRSKTAISFDQITENARLTEPIMDYLHDLIPIVASVKNSLKNQYLGHISKLIF